MFKSEKEIEEYKKKTLTDYVGHSHLGSFWPKNIWGNWSQYAIWSPNHMDDFMVELTIFEWNGRENPQTWKPEYFLHDSPQAHFNKYFGHFKTVKAYFSPGKDESEDFKGAVWFPLWTIPFAQDHKSGHIPHAYTLESFIGDMTRLRYEYPLGTVNREKLVRYQLKEQEYHRMIRTSLKPVLLSVLIDLVYHYFGSCVK